MNELEPTELEKLIVLQESSWQRENWIVLVKQFLIIAFILAWFFGLVYVVSKVKESKTVNHLEMPRNESFTTSKLQTSASEE